MQQHSCHVTYCLQELKGSSWRWKESTWSACDTRKP